MGHFIYWENKNMKTNLVTASAIKEAILRGTSRRIHGLKVEEPKQQ